MTGKFFLAFKLQYVQVIDEHLMNEIIEIKANVIYELFFAMRTTFHLSIFP